MLAVIEGKPPVIYGDGEQSRDFTHVENIEDEGLRACEAGGISGRVFNGGTDVRVTLNEVLRQLEKITGKKIQAKYERASSGDILQLQADISLARKILGYEPRVHFEDGLKRKWKWYKATYGKK
jgi:nucleoside-diphosphate-sugar epimerase